MNTPMFVEPDKRQAWEEEILALAKQHEPLTAEIVVKRARNKGSALHDMFTWDDTEAAKRYRLLEAGGLIRRVKARYITTNEDEEPIRYLGHVKVMMSNGTSQSGFMLMPKILKSDDLTAQLLAEANRSLVTFRHKFAVIKELSSIMSSIDNYLDGRGEA